MHNTIEKAIFCLEQMKKNPKGFTIDIEFNITAKHGFVAAYKETQNSFGLSGLEKVLTFAETAGSKIVGGWYNEENGQFYWDCSRIFSSKEKAIEFGKNNGQIAIFDLYTSKEIRIK